ncbi:MAG: transglutaminase-like domain-containing protein [Planctomycetaceae bacterium]|jgi:transglutaminase-like putative cysteine protease|nr:transglutaminase-like domain-containing protein [Planctomycetaceae bacterium]
MLKKLFFVLIVISCIVGVVFIFYGTQLTQLTQLGGNLISQFIVHSVDKIVTDDLLKNGGEYWEIITDDKQQIGFQKTSISEKYFEQKSRVTLLRHGERFDVAMTSVSESSVDGFFNSGMLELKIGWNKPIVTSFEIKDSMLIISTDKNQSSMKWSDTEGADAVIKSLLKKPMQSSEKRKIKYFDPSQSQVVETVMVAGEICNLDKYGGAKLQKIAVQNFIDGKIILQSYYYTDRGGNIIHTETNFGDRIITASRVSKKYAMGIVSNDNLVEYSYSGEILLPVSIISPRELKSITFLVKKISEKISEKSSEKNGEKSRNNSSSFGQIADWFVDSPFQKVEIIDSNKAVITVWSSIGEVPAEYGNKEYKINNNVTNNTEQLDEYLTAGRLIDLDDPELQKLAETINSDKLTVWQTAVLLERLVSRIIRLNSFSFGFAAASEVLQTGRGDCTEFAILLTALCRIKGIPSRVALGLVYEETRNKGKDNLQNSEKESELAKGKMIFHLWTEVYVNGIWRPLDAMYKRGGADAARIKITDDSLKNDSISQICRSILTIIGQVEIDINK